MSQGVDQAEFLQLLIHNKLQVEEQPVALLIAFLGTVLCRARFSISFNYPFSKEMIGLCCRNRKEIQNTEAMKFPCSKFTFKICVRI